MLTNDVEESLNDFKRSIRAKLRLSERARLFLVQTQEGRRIDLEDGPYATACRTINTAAESLLSLNDSLIPIGR